MVSDAASSTEIDSVYMRRALALAEGGWGQTAPNPMVGAVVVAGDEIVGEGYHARYGEAHAEVGALRAAGKHTLGATLYVTLEPCAHHGKTPPCVDAVIDAGIARVVIAVSDPSVVARGGAERLRRAGIDVEMGVERRAALELNAPFFNAHASNRPWVTLKLAISADGAVADPRGLHRWITGSESRAYVHRLRANSDAIAVGIGTVLADDPELTVRDAAAPRIPPRRVVFDTNLRIPATSRVIRGAREIPTTVFVARERSRARPDIVDAGADIVDTNGSLSNALSWLREHDVRSLFVEAGPRLAGSFLRESLVDRLIIFRSSLVLGADAPKAFAFAPPGFEASVVDRPLVDERRFGDDIMTIYALRDVPCSQD